MATKQSKPSTHNRRISDLLRFLDSFQVALRNFSERAPPMLPDLQKHIEALPLPQQVLSETDKEYLHKQGTHLWNSCTKLRWGNPGDEEMRVLCHARAFSYLVLDSVQGATQAGWTKMMRLSLKATKDCLDLKETKLATKLMERSTVTKRSLLTANAGDSPSGEHNVDRLAFEHDILELSVAWQQNRSDLVEQTLEGLLAKGPLPQSLPILDLAATLCEIGKDAYHRSQNDVALHWLDRAMNIIPGCGTGDASEDLGRLKLEILQLLARVHLTADGGEGRPKALEILRVLNIDHSQEPTTVLLGLKLLCTEGTDLQSFYEVLSNTISRLSLTEPIVNIILQRIKLLKDHDSSLACKAVDQLLRKLVECGEDASIEKTLVTRFWMSTTVPDRVLGVSDTSELLTDTSIAWAKTLTANATYAILVLLWKNVESDFNKGNFSTAASWCRLSQHTILQRMGESDQAKFERKILDCALQIKEVQLARETFASMSKKGKSNASTQYLMYKVALADGDEELGLQCFENLCRTDSGPDGNKYIFGCIFEAQQSGNKHQAALVLEKLLEKHGHGAPRDIHVPALLRCAVRLLVSELDNDRPETIEAICRIFKGGAYQARKSQGLDDARAFSLNELEWFSRNSYNLALQQCAVWPSNLLLRLLESCAEFMDLYPSDTPTALFKDLALRRLFCSFLSCAFHVTQARLPTNTAENQLQNHLLVRTHALIFYSFVHMQLLRFDAVAKADLVKKYRSVLLFDFEAAARLKAWEALREILDLGEGVADEKAYGVFADVVLASEAPLATKGFLLMRILNSIRQQSSFNTPTATLSRHLRCVFQLALDSDFTVAESLLDQAIVLAREGAVAILPVTSSDPPNRYPAEEAEWLATTAFNTAIDFYIGEDDVEAKNWGEKAVEMAGFAGEDEILVGLLKGRLEGLDWGRA